MTFIRTRKLRFKEDGTILSRTTDLIKSIYIQSDCYHSRKKVIEELDKVI